MGVSARRLRSLQRAHDCVHEQAFDRSKRQLYPLRPAYAATAPYPMPPVPVKTRMEILDERVKQSIQREFAKLGLS